MTIHRSPLFGLTLLCLAAAFVSSQESPRKYIARPKNNTKQIFGSAPPYGGTIFVDGDIINDSDHESVLRKIELYTNEQCVRVYNFAVESYERVDAHIFDVTFADTVVTQFWVRTSDWGGYDLQEATEQVLFYALELGRLPQFLRRGVHVTTIQRGDFSWGGLENRITIHAGNDFSNQGEAGTSRDIYAETFVHEAAHAAIDDFIYGTVAWNNAVSDDPGFISEYARDFPDSEDVAESVLLWLGVKIGSINDQASAITVGQIPNRMSFFDYQDYNLYPLGTDSGEIDDSYEWENLEEYNYPCGVFGREGEKTIVYSYGSPTSTPTSKPTPMPTKNLSTAGRKIKFSLTKYLPDWIIPNGK